MRPTLLAFFFLLAYPCYAQNIKGKVVKQKTGIPLTGAHIHLKNNKIGATSDENGKFSIPLKSKISKQDTIYVSYVGYKARQITFDEFEKFNFIIALSENDEKLEEISVSTNKELKRFLEYKKVSSLKHKMYAFGSTLVGSKIFIIGGDKSAFSNSNLEESYLYTSNSPGSNLEEIIREINRPKINFNCYNGYLQIYDIESNSWKIITSRFEKRAYHNIHSFKNKLFVIGGKRLSRNMRYEYLSDKIEVYDTQKYTAEIDHTNPHQAVNYASVIYKDNVIIIGGSTKLKSNGKKDYTNKVHLYNLTSGYWYELENMPQEKEVTGILIENKIYLVGGYKNKILKNIESFDLVKNNWECEGELFQGMFRPALAYNNQMLYIFENGKICTFNTKTKELKEYLVGLYLNHSAMFYYNNRLYILGGFIPDENSISPSSKLYCIDINQFDQTKINQSVIFSN